MGKLRIFTARRIVTMEPAQPAATAVAVLDGAIASVGSLADLEPWRDAHDTVIDDTFADMVLLPGLIDPHVHPFLPAVLTQMPFVAPEAWDLPSGHWPAAHDREEFLRRVADAFAAHTDHERPFFCWGYHHLFHGSVDRATLDREISVERPVFCWHRSFHEIIANSAGIAWLGLDGASAVPGSIDIDRGVFAESGLGAVLGRVQPLFFDPDRIGAGLDEFAAMVHRGGVTTAADMGLGIYGDLELELAAAQSRLESEDVPFRILVAPIVNAFAGRGTAQDAVAACEDLQSRSGHRVFFDRHFKVLVDGAFFSQLMRLSAPGYVDGHVGQWIHPPETTREYVTAFWRAGYQVHAHVNGDEGVGFTLDLLNELLDRHPRFDHRFTLEHYGYATEDQNRRVAALGAQVSANPYYLHMLGDAYAVEGLGVDRASQIGRLGSLVARGVPVALHSDCPMAPLSPLTLAWCAAARQTLSGTVRAPAEALTLDEALRAVTIDAAWVLGLEDRVGSVRAGKSADFTVVDADPHEVGVDGLRDLKVKATVFEGRVFETDGP